MALPWLIAGLGVAAVAAYKALSDDDSSSSSSSSSGSEDAERRRREAVEKERKERERAYKLKTAKEDFQKQGRIFGHNLAQALPSDLVEATSRGEFELDFDLSNGQLRFDMEEASQRDSHLFATVDGLETILTKSAAHKASIENLVTFSELYKPEFQHGSKLREKEEHIKRLDEAIDKLQTIRHQLIKMQQKNQSPEA